MPNKELGIADPVYDALRIRSGQSIAPDLGGGTTGGSGLENKIQVWHADGSAIDLFDATETGLNSALAAASTGDTVWLPSISITLIAAITIPADIVVTAITGQAKLLFGGLASAAITLSASSGLERLYISQTANDANTLITVQGPSSGVAQIGECVIICTQSGAGTATVFNSGAGSTFIHDCTLTGAVVNNSRIESTIITGNIVNQTGGYLEGIYLSVATGTGITQAAVARISKCWIQTGAAATYGIDISSGYCSHTVVGTDGGTTSTGIYAHGANVEIYQSRFAGYTGGKIEQAYIVASCEFYASGGTPANDSHGLTHATTGTATIDNSTFICGSVNSFGAYITATGLTLTDCAWSSISGLANITYGTGDRSPLNHTHTSSVIGYISGNISNPPTEAEFESLLGTPASVGAGAAYIVRDTSTDRLYLAISDGAQFVYSPFISSTAGGGGASFFELVAAGAHIAPGWCWFADPRALYYNGVTYFGYVTADGDIFIRKYTHSTQTVSTPFNLHPVLQIDDHVNPALLIRDSDKKILAAYSQHVGTTIYLRISSNAEDISAWGSEASLDASIGGGYYTYPSLLQLTGEVNDPIYLFYREHRLITDDPPYIAFSKSTDGGATWAADTLLANITYHKIVANGDARIDFVASNHPAEAHDHGIYHFYMQGGNYYKSDGTQIVAALPFSHTDTTQVYDGSSVKGWIWDIAIDGSGNPIIVYATFPTTSDHRYNYAKWTGAAWDKHEITAAGGTIDVIDVNAEYYSGGVVLDHTDPQIVYLSKVVSGQHEIYKYVTADGGATWSSTAITSGSSGKQLRPVAIRNHASDLKFLWLGGTYTSYTNWNLALLGSGQ